MKVFISLPMNGRNDVVVREDQTKFLKDLESDMREKNDLSDGESLELIDTVSHVNVPENPSRLWYLGEAIKKLDNADLVYFAGDWYKAKGCWVEFVAASVYGKKMIFDYPDRKAANVFENIIGWLGAFTTQPENKEKKKDD